MMTARGKKGAGALAGIVLLAALALGRPAFPERRDSADALAWLATKAAFAQFVDDFWPVARRAGISRRTYARAFSGVTPDPDVIRRLGRQPEFSTPVWAYIAKRVTDARIARGREKLRRLFGVLGAIERKHGVSRRVLLAIWGMETNYGSYTGKDNVIRALATLAFTGRKRKYGRTQLIAALKILQHGDISPKAMTGSWAGAMGHTQFIPTTYLGYARDFDHDGRRDIWNNLGDALASSANYLKKRGWRPGRPWGWEVVLPRGFDYRMSGFGRPWRVSQWVRMGVRPAAAARFYAGDARAWVILPAGRKGPAFLVTDNFRAILAYNNSIAYALAVGHLADRIGGAGPIVASWPVRQRMLSRAERIELQRHLARQGYYRGTFRGHIGPKTRAAVRRYQHTAGLPADGYASPELLRHLRKGR